MTGMPRSAGCGKMNVNGLQAADRILAAPAASILLEGLQQPRGWGAWAGGVLPSILKRISASTAARFAFNIPVRSPFRSVSRTEGGRK